MTDCDVRDFVKIRHGDSARDLSWGNTSDGRSLDFFNTMKDTIQGQWGLFHRNLLISMQHTHV
ncbi:MAG: hypothetical protein ACFB0C_14135 [Leptolyngbyaceae cyanobacterium]